MTDEPRGGLNRAGSTAWSALGVALLVLLAGWALGKLMAVVLPIAVAVLLATLLRPIATRLEQRRVRPALAAIISVLIAVLVLVGLIALILPPFIAKLTDLGSSLEEGVQRVAYSLGESLAGMDRAEVDRQLESAVDRGAGAARRHRDDRDHVAGRRAGERHPRLLPRVLPGQGRAPHVDVGARFAAQEPGAKPSARSASGCGRTSPPTRAASCSWPRSTRS